jgi:hypothetical protein
VTELFPELLFIETGLGKASKSIEAGIWGLAGLGRRLESQLNVL